MLFLTFYVGSALDWDLSQHKMKNTVQYPNTTVPYVEPYLSYKIKTLESRYGLRRQFVQYIVLDSPAFDPAQLYKKRKTVRQNSNL